MTCSLSLCACLPVNIKRRVAQLAFRLEPVIHLARARTACRAPARSASCKTRVTKSVYLEAFDPAVAALKTLKAILDDFHNVQQLSEVNCVRLLKVNAGEVAERLNAAVC